MNFRGKKYLSTNLGRVTQQGLSGDTGGEAMVPVAARRLD